MVLWIAMGVLCSTGPGPSKMNLQHIVSGLRQGSKTLKDQGHASFPLMLLQVQFCFLKSNPCILFIVATVAPGSAFRSDARRSFWTTSRLSSRKDPKVF